MFGLAWWVWLLIAVAVAGIGYLKLKVLNTMIKKKPKNQPNQEKDED
jgi:hypothetical protein